jgi:hypothetical protein
MTTHNQTSLCKKERPARFMLDTKEPQDLHPSEPAARSGRVKADSWDNTTQSSMITVTSNQTSAHDTVKSSTSESSGQSGQDLSTAS